MVYHLSVFYLIRSEASGSVYGLMFYKKCALIKVAPKVVMI